MAIKFGVKSKRRSGLEDDIEKDLKKYKFKYKYESLKLFYTQVHSYTPDFILANGIIIEAKGYLDKLARTKMKYIKKTHPTLDIRFIFQDANKKITKKSKTTYAMWAEQYGFPWAHKKLPKEWCQ